MFAEPDARNLGGDFFERTTVFVAGLHVPRVDLAWAARHPEQNAMSPSLRVGGQLSGERRQPTAYADPTRSKRHRLKQTSPIDQIQFGHVSILVEYACKQSRLMV